MSAGLATVIPLLRREHVAGFYARRPVWLTENLGLERIRDEARAMEHGAAEFYVRAAARTQDAATRKLLGDLAAAEAGHERHAEGLEADLLGPEVRDGEDKAARRQFILTWVQPGLAGLMDGSVSTLAPIFATAFATQNTWTTFLVGLAASVGAGISMGFTEAAHDDGVLSGRGSPFKRGLASGVMTAVGGLGHALPYLITDFWTATTHCDGGGVCRIVGDCLDSEQIHGDAVPEGGLAGGAGRGFGVCGGGVDWRRLRAGPALGPSENTVESMPWFFALRVCSQVAAKACVGRGGVKLWPYAGDLAENSAVLCGDWPWLWRGAGAVFQRRGHGVSDEIRVLLRAVGDAVWLCRQSGPERGVFMGVCLGVFSGLEPCVGASWPAWR